MINLEKMKKKLESSLTNGKSDKKDDVFFKPEEGDQDVRFLPSDDGDPFKEYYFHYGLGESFLCPKRNFQEPCAVCDYASSLWRDGTDESKKQAKALFARQRFFTNVVKRNQDGTFVGPKPYGYGKTTYEQLIQIVLDPDYGDVTDPETGRDFRLNYKKPENKGAYPKTTLTAKPKQTPLTKVKKEIKDILDKAKPIESFLTRFSSTEVAGVLEGFMESIEAKDKTEDKKYGSPDKKSTSEVNSVDDAIKELEDEAAE